MIRPAALTLLLLSTTTSVFPASSSERDKSDPGRHIDGLQEACGRKETDACSELADLYIFGNGVTLRPEKARQFLSGICALDRHDPEPCLGAAVGLACRRLAAMHENGEGLKKDPLIAAGYYRIGSERGDAVSSVALSRMFEEGTAIPKDAARAQERLLKACRQKDFLSRQCGITEVRVVEYEKTVAEACAAAGPMPDDAESPTHGEFEVFLALGPRSLREPRKVYDVPPRYPPKARSAHIQGQVILETSIDVDGRVVDMKVQSGPPALTDAAVAAVAQWRYSPTLKDGVPVPVIMTVTVTFRLSWR